MELLKNENQGLFGGAAGLGSKLESRGRRLGGIRERKSKGGRFAMAVWLDRAPTHD